MVTAAAMISKIDWSLTLISSAKGKIFSFMLVKSSVLMFFINEPIWPQPRKERKRRGVQPSTRL